MRHTLCAGLLAALVALPAGAADQESDYLINTGDDLADLCSAPEDVAAIHMCHGYLVGVNQMHTGIAAAWDVDIYCIPENTPMTRNQFATDFAQWVHANDQRGQMPARRALLTFASQVFPCS